MCLRIKRIETQEPTKQEWRALVVKPYVAAYFFSVQRLYGFRQVVQHVQLHVTN